MLTEMLEEIRDNTRNEYECRRARARIHEALMALEPHTPQRERLHHTERDYWTAAEKHGHTRHTIARIIRQSADLEREEADRLILDAIARGMKDAECMPTVGPFAVPA